MLLQEQEIKDIIMSRVLTNKDQINLVQTYITERKKVQIENLKLPKNLVQVQLLQIAFNSAIEYYTEKYFKR